jgi:ectoine hydroxylase-related dioxygenase (phytanoyl-CoA dioxygenase family)
MAAATPAVDATKLTGQFNAHGFCVVERVFQPSEMQPLAATISELAAAEVAALQESGVMARAGALDWASAEEYSAWQRATPSWKETVTAMSKVQVIGGSGELIARKLNTPLKDYEHLDDFRKIALDPRMTNLASQLFGGRKAQVFSDQVFIKPPEVGGPKPYHQDNWYFGVTSSDDVLTAWVALDDAVEENGALRYIDGAHLCGLVPHAITDVAEPYNVNAPEAALDRAREVVAPVGQGGVVFHHGAALHSSSDNRTPAHRRAYAIHYVRTPARAQATTSGFISFVRN